MKTAQPVYIMPLALQILKSRFSWMDFSGYKGKIEMVSLTHFRPPFKISPTNILLFRQHTVLLWLSKTGIHKSGPFLQSLAQTLIKYTWAC